MSAVERISQAVQATTCQIVHVVAADVCELCEQIKEGNSSLSAAEQQIVVDQYHGCHFAVVAHGPMVEVDILTERAEFLLKVAKA